MMSAGPVKRADLLRPKRAIQAGKNTGKKTGEEMDDHDAEISGETYEETWRGYHIYLTPNTDHWRIGVAWSVCDDEAELQCGMAFSLDAAVAESHAAIVSLAA
jgi:hypothetical protein